MLILIVNPFAAIEREARAFASLSLLMEMLSEVEFIEDESGHVANNQLDRQPEFRPVDHGAPA